MPTIERQAIKDATIDSEFPTQTDNGATLEIGANSLAYVRRFLIHFDVTTIPSTASIQSATLQLYCESVPFNPSLTIESHAARLTQPNWVETEVDWNEYATGQNWANPAKGGDYTSVGAVAWSAPTATGFFTITQLGSLVQDAIQNRSGHLHLMVFGKEETAGRRTFSSRSSLTTSQRPKLTVTYGLASRKARKRSMYRHDVKQNTSPPTFLVGPFLNQSDGRTPVTMAGLTLGSITCRILKPGESTSTTVVLADGTNFHEVGSGMFRFTPAGNTYSNLLGPLWISFSSPTQFEHVENMFRIIPEKQYDWNYGLTFYLDTMATDLDNMQGAGFATSTDSLEALRDRFDAVIAPAVTGATALSGSGFLSTTVQMIRQLTDEPDVNQKYSTADILTYLRGSMSSVMSDINVNTDHPVVCRVSIPLVIDKQVYTLPPQCQKFYYLACYDTTTGRKRYEILPGSLWDFSQYGFRLEGNTIRFLAKPKSTDTLEAAFVPNSEPYPHKADTATYTTTTVTLAATPTDGALDTRPQAYTGYILRVLASTDSAAVYVQDRIITNYNNQTRVATVAEAFSPALAGTITYEVVPMYSELLRQVWALHTAMTLLAVEGASKRYNLIHAEYQRRLRALRLTLHKEFRLGASFEGRTSTNDLNPWGFGVLGSRP